MPIKCESCDKIAVWYDIAYPIEGVPVAACDDHVNLECDHPFCDFVERDENGKRIHGCSMRTWSYNEKGWVEIHPQTVRPIGAIRGLQSKP